MAEFTVINIVDGDTFDVDPGWAFKEKTGKRVQRVRPVGYNAPEMDTEAGKYAKKRLSDLILGKKVQLGTVHQFHYDRLVCEVSFNGKDLASYFKE